MPLKVLVIDDHPLVQQGVSTALGGLAEDVRVMSAHDGDEGLATAAGHPDLDLVLLDLALPGISGFSLIEKLHAQHPSLPVVVLSAYEEPENVRHAISAGAMGFIPKSAATRVLIDVLQQVLEGNVVVPTTLQSPEAMPQGEFAPENEAMSGNEPDVALLTMRQVEVLSRICEGKTNKQIAIDLGLSEKTIKAHVTAIFKSLNVVNRTQAVLAARRVGVVAN